MKFAHKSRLFGRIIVLSALTLVFFPHSAKADSYTVSGVSDFYVTFTEGVDIEVRAYAQQYGIDSMLWLYDTRDGALVAVNDDYYGLDSFVKYKGEPNVTYRLRAGVCCWDPERWYGSFYFIEINYVLNEPTTTTLFQETTTVPETTTTELVTTTTEESTTTTVPSTTIETFPSTSLYQPQEPSSTSSVVERTTTTFVTSTTALPVPTTSIYVEETTTTTLRTPKTTLPQETTTTLLENSSTTTLPSIIENTNVTPVTDYIETQIEQLPVEQLTEVFNSLKIDALSDTEVDALVEVLNNKSDDVKQKFEDAVNVFSGQFDSYVPSGSKINVGQRKVLIAATGVIFMAPTVSSTSGSTSPETRSRRK